MLGNEQIGGIREIRELQREMYLPLSSKLLEYARREYLALCNALRHEPLVGPEDILTLNQDFPIIKKVYAVIARSYERHSPDLEKVELEGHLNQELRRHAWQNYFQLEAQRLATIPSFTDRLLQAVLETDSGISAELEIEILRFLRLEYPASE